MVDKSASTKKHIISEDMIMLPCAEIELLKCIAGLCQQPFLLELKDKDKVHFSCSLIISGPGAATLNGKKVLAGI